jgi:hypothetical protein
MPGYSASKESNKYPKIHAPQIGSHHNMELSTPSDLKVDLSQMKGSHTSHPHKIQDHSVLANRVSIRELLKTSMAPQE